MICSFLRGLNTPRDYCFPGEKKQRSYTKYETETIANWSITLYGVTPQVYLLNKTDYKGNVSLGRLPSARKWNFTAGSSHILVNWVSWIQGGFEKSYNHRERRQPGTCNRPLNKCIYFLWLLLDDYVTKRYLRKKMYDRRYFQPSKISLSGTPGGNIASRKAKTLIKIN